ncbi:hypothetical protein EON81_28295, partial [bacterium]
MSVYDPNPIERTKRKLGFAIILAGLINEIWPELEDRHRVVLPAMLSHMGLGSGHPSQSRLARMTGFTRKHINKITTELDAAQIITKERRKSDDHRGDYSCNYTLTDLDDEDNHEAVLERVKLCKSLGWDVKNIRNAIASEAAGDEAETGTAADTDAKALPAQTSPHGLLDHQPVASPIKSSPIASIRNGPI